MLYQKILNKLDEERGLADQYCTVAGYKNGNALRKSLRENREFGSFQGLVNLVQELFPNDEKQLMAEYAMTLDPNKQTARYMLEYCELNKLMEAKEKLMKDMLECTNSQSKEWANVYYVEHRFTKGEINLNEAISAFGALKPKHLESEIATEIYKSYCYLASRMHDIIMQIMVGLEYKIEQLKEKYIKESFLGRHSLLLISYNVRKGNLKIARKAALEIFERNSMLPFLTLICLHIGNSYIMESFETSYFYLKKGLECAANEPHLRSGVISSINFLHNVWGKESDFIKFNSKDYSDLHEVAFYYINKNEVVKAEEVLNSICIEKLCDNSKGFHYYLRGKISHDINTYSESVSFFIKSGDVYFRQFPLLEMRKLNVPESIINALSL